MATLQDHCDHLVGSSRRSSQVLQSINHFFPMDAFSCSHLDLEGFCFKGSRDYIQGPDIFIACAKLAGEGYFLEKLVFNSFTKNHCWLSFDRRVSVESRVIATGIFSKEGSNKKEFKVIEGPEQVAQRREYEEFKITAVTSIENSMLRSPGSHEFTAIENIVSLIKFLSNKLSPLNQGRWVFAKIDCNRELPETWKNIKIVRTKCLASKFSLSKVWIDNVEICTVKFAATES